MDFHFIKVRKSSVEEEEQEEHKKGDEELGLF
jgi:hypothetical protein